MEKIQIQFKESDYKIYYDYCLKYYQVHDKARKQSIHAFLDLFKKDIISVEEQDLVEAQDLISRKCEDLKKRPDDTSREDDKTLVPDSWTCGDLLIFIEDLEKIYCLIEKQGITANYLMILGTFSNVIADEKSSQISVMYDLKSEMIESLADPLVDIVQMRMGSHRQWRSALRELTVIAAQFNHRSFEPKFDLGILQLVAPTVVSRFNEDVNTKEILSLLPSYFEECELEEFENFLNRTPDQIKDEHDSDINWDAICKPLNIVVSAIASQRDQRSEDNSKISDPYLTPPTKETESPDNRLNSVESPPLPTKEIESPDSRLNSVESSPPGYHYPILEDGYKTSDIAVSPDLTTHEEDPKSVLPVFDTEAIKTRIQPFIPIIIGAGVILLVIIGIVIISGNWNPLAAGNTTNSTIKNVTTAKPASTPAPQVTTAKPATTPAPQVTTAKPTAAPTPTSPSYSSSDIGNHLIEIAFSPSNNIIEKPLTKNLLESTFSGLYDKNDVALLNDFITQFNSYSTTQKISTSINFDSPADVWIDFLPGFALSQLNVDVEKTVIRDGKTGTYYLVRTDEKTYVNSDLKGNERKRWILRAILLNLGFPGETLKYTDSVFYTGASNASQLSDIDQKALQLMYGSKVTNGMTRSDLKSIVS